MIQNQLYTQNDGYIPYILYISTYNPYIPYTLNNRHVFFLGPHDPCEISTPKQPWISQDSNKATAIGHCVACLKRLVQTATEKWVGSTNGLSWWFHGPVWENIETEVTVEIYFEKLEKITTQKFGSPTVTSAAKSMVL